MAEQWVRWEPIKGLSNKYFIEYLSADYERLDLILSDAYKIKNNVRIVYAFYPGLHQRVNKKFKEQRLELLHARYGKEFFDTWTFFKVNNSEYSKWLSEQSDTISDSYQLRHFAFVCANSIVDVFSSYEPEITELSRL
jgi:hypothetical protein